MPYIPVLSKALFFPSELRSSVWTEGNFQRSQFQKGLILASVSWGATTTLRLGDQMPLSGSLSGGSSHCQTQLPLLGFLVFILICEYKFSSIQSDT